MTTIPSHITPESPRMSGNPVFPGWYADPEIHFFEGRYYIYPTTSRSYYEQTYFECFSSDDLTNWKNEGIILNFDDILWTTQFAAWAPSCAEKDGKYYLYFSAGDGAGIGVAVADKPYGPFRDALGHPLVGTYPFGAQPIDAHCFQDDDGRAYLYFGGHGKCVVAPLTPTMRAFNRAFRDITPTEDYVEGPFMIKRKGRYYLMWSEGGWGNDTYRAAYGVADNPYGPFEKAGTILTNIPTVATTPSFSSPVRKTTGLSATIAAPSARPTIITALSVSTACTSTTMALSLLSSSPTKASLPIPLLKPAASPLLCCASGRHLRRLPPREEK